MRTPAQVRTPGQVAAVEVVVRIEVVAGLRVVRDPPVQTEADAVATEPEDARAVDVPADEVRETARRAETDREVLRAEESGV